MSEPSLSPPPITPGLLAAALLSCALLALPGSSSAAPARAPTPTAGAHRKLAVIAAGYYRSQDREHLVEAIRRAGLPAGVPVYLGTYGVDAADAAAARSLPGGRYAPLVTPQGKDHPKRKLSADEEKKLPRALDRYAGALPPLAGLSPDERYHWGEELGRRIRDQLRAAARAGVTVDAVQFDEIWPSASADAKHAEEILPFLRGALDGVRSGRTALGDHELKALVHCAHPNALFALPARGVAHAFLKTLELTAIAVIGEQYPPFRGDPKAAAKASLAGRNRLARGDAGARALAARYVAGLTPGLKEVPGLGGRQPGQSAAAARTWRAEYLTELVREGVHGLSEFNFVPEDGHVAGSNADPAELRAVFAEIAAAQR